MNMHLLLRIDGGRKDLNKYQWLKLVLSLMILVLGSCNKASTGYKSKRPNLLIVIADQWRGSALGFLGQEPVKTPHIDQFATESLAQTEVISNAPVCTPSRAMLMSGQYPERSKVWGNANTKGYEMKTSTETWSDVLNKQGYSLGYIGKWHLDIPKKPYVDVHNNRGRVKWDAWTPPERRHGFKFWYAYGTYDQHLKPMYWTSYAPKKAWFYINEWEPTHDADVAIKFIEI